MNGPFKDLSQDILYTLTTKSCTKQRVYERTLAVFNRMRELGVQMTGQYASVLSDHDPLVQIEQEEKGDFEFQVKLAGDLLIFDMHSNVVTFPSEHLLINNDYVKENAMRGYFGQIMVYNFMADTVKYNRLGDEGYMIARMLINTDGHFYVEGVRQLNFLFPDISKNIITDELLVVFMQNVMKTAIETDLVAPAFQSMTVINYDYKLSNAMIGTGGKLGFQMRHNLEN